MCVCVCVCVCVRSPLHSMHALICNTLFAPYVHVILSPKVLATGLSGLYSELPSSREIAVDDWQSPLPVIEEAVPELRRSTQALNFCNSVLQVYMRTCIVS